VAGDLTSDGTCTPCWTYDYAGHLTADHAGASFAYDGLGNRVQRSYGGTTYDFVLDNGGNAALEYQGSVPSRFTGGLFTYANNSTYFPRPDHLGTPRVTTDYTGGVKRTQTNLAFGDNFSETTSPFVDFTGFADGVWDAENNSDHFGAREYAKTQGRWMTPDPAGLAAVNPRNPQTWNRYAYVTNNPVSYRDPSGLVSMPNVGTYANGGGGGGFDCQQDGVDQSCDTVTSVLGGGGAVECPNDNCGVGTATPYQCLDIVCGYYSSQYVASHENTCGAVLCTDSQHTQWITANNPGGVDAQRVALAQRIAANSNGAISYQDAYDSLTVEGGYFKGGNYNFVTPDYDAGDLSCGADDLRCNGVHFSGQDASGDWYVHLDTSNPFGGDAFSFLEHSFVDVFLGNVYYYVIPRPWP